jgi:hypothetical protein
MLILKRHSYEYILLLSWKFCQLGGIYPDLLCSVFVNLFFRHGGIIGYELSTNQKKFEYDFNECNDTQAVAVYNDILVAGFRDGSVKVIY